MSEEIELVEDPIEPGAMGQRFEPSENDGIPDKPISQIVNVQDLSFVCKFQDAGGKKRSWKITK